VVTVTASWYTPGEISTRSPGAALSTAAWIVFWSFGTRIVRAPPARGFGACSATAAGTVPSALRTITVPYICVCDAPWNEHEYP